MNITLHILTVTLCGGLLAAPALAQNSAPEIKFDSVPNAIQLPAGVYLGEVADGSAIGAMFGALVFGIVEEGIVFAGVDANWYKAVVGLILLLAVLLNSYVRKLAMEARR